MAAAAIWATIERVKVLLTFAPGSRCKFFDVLIPLDSLLADKRLERPGVWGGGWWVAQSRKKRCRARAPASEPSGYRSGRDERDGPERCQEDEK